MALKAPGERLFHVHGSATYYKEQLEKATTAGRISNQDKNLILKYVAWRHSNKPSTGLRKTKIAQVLTGWRRFIKRGWEDCTADDIRHGMTLLSESEYAQNTQNDYWKDLKPFMKWLKKKGLSRIDIDDIGDIKGAGINADSHSAADLLSVDEIEAIIRVAGSTRNRAIIALLFESAARIYELSRLKWKDIDFSSPPLVQMVIHDTKTKKRRYVPLIKNVAYLGAWRNEYKGFTGREPAPEDYVFVDERGFQMRYPAMRQVIVRAAEKAGLNGKRVHPHLLRASAITQLIREGYRESTVREVAWGNQGTDMFKHYLKLSQDDINREFRQKAGVETLEDQVKPRVPVICPHCTSSNPPAAKFCLQCGIPLKEETRKYIEAKTQMIEQSPRHENDIEKMVERMVEEKLKKMQAAGP